MNLIIKMVFLFSLEILKNSNNNILNNVINKINIKQTIGSIV